MKLANISQFLKYLRQVLNEGRIRGVNQMRKTGKFITKLWNNESGISSVEYALLLAFVAAGIIVAADSLSNAVSNEMNEASTCIEASTNAAIAACG